MRKYFARSAYLAQQHTLDGCNRALCFLTTRLATSFCTYVAQKPMRGVAAYVDVLDGT
jgi:hypothetical protein